MTCVISGIGKTCAAAATAWAAGLQHTSASICWINLGVAGGADHSIGDIFRLDRITEKQTDRSHYPVTVFHSDIKTASCISLDQASIDYHPADLYDMEASAFFSTALRFSSVELVHSLKIIGDNRDQPPEQDKSIVSALVSEQIRPITGFAESLITLNEKKCYE
ncbi:MAG: hypothetical protein HKN34_00230 [Gammaproteobacteria bacterium]|nr:hypothetical protein [Gammaproteobacteria bacterium]